MEPTCPDFILHQTGNPNLATDPVKVLTVEIGPWSLYNFPESREYPERAVLGIVEEWGELVEAITKRLHAEVEDAVGDVMVYSADLCSKIDLNMAEIFGRAEIAAATLPNSGNSHLEGGAVITLGKLSHSSLKASQSIRGSAEQHRLNIATYLEDLYVWLILVCRDQKLRGAPITVQACVSRAWGEVRLRDWQAKRREGSNSTDT